MSRLWVYGALVLLLILTGCPEDVGGHRRKMRTPIDVWADPALKGVLEKLEPEFRKHHRGGWKIDYMESADMNQMSLGVFPDILLAVEPKAQELLKVGILDESSMRTFAGDRLAVVSSREKPRALASVGDLVVTMFDTIAVGGQDTSLGRYSEQALIADGAHGKIAKQMKTYGSQAEIVAVVASGESDYGIVYASTAVQNPELSVATTVPEDLHEDIKYTAVAAVGRKGRPGVVALLKLLAEEPETQKLLGGYGFVDRLTALREE